MRGQAEKTKKQYDFTQGGYLKPMLMFSIPVLFGDVFSVLYNVVDSIVVGQYVGSHALAAVNSSFAITLVCVAIYAGFGMGAGVVIGQIFGAKQTENLKKAVATAFAGAFFVGITMSVVGLLISKPLLLAIHTPAEILDDANIYLRIFMCGCATQLFYYMTSGIMRSMGDSQTPMQALILCAVLNIVLDIIFVVVFNMGCAGVALATVIAQALSAVMVVSRVMMGAYGFKLTRKDLKLDAELLAVILKIGVPFAFQQLINSLGLLLIQSYANTFGTNLVASNGIIQKLDSFTLIPVQALGQTITMFNAQNIGAGKWDRVKKGNQKGMALIFAVGVVAGIFLFFCVEPLYRLFINSNDPGSAQILEIGRVSVRILAFFYCVAAIQNGYVAILKGVGAGIPVMIIVIVSILVYVPLTYFLAVRTGHYEGLYWAKNVFNSVMAVGAICYYRFGNWQRFRTIKQSDDEKNEIQKNAIG